MELSLAKILWRMIPERRRELMLGYGSELDRKLIKTLLEGRLDYPEAFDQRRCIFIHIPKTGGTSLHAAIFGQQSAKGHIPAYWYRAVDKEKFGEYFKFTVIRNPWDRVLSAFHYLRLGGAGGTFESQRSEAMNHFSSFDDFVRSWLDDENVSKILHFVPQYKFLQDEYGINRMDYIGKFESLEADFQKILGKLNLDTRPLPEKRKSTDTKPHYRSQYTEETRAIVAQVYRKDIEDFGYSF